MKRKLLQISIILFCATSVVAYVVLLAKPVAAAAKPRIAKRQPVRPAIQGNMTMACEFNASALLDAGPKVIEGKVSKGSGPLNLVVVDNRLVIVAKDGGEKLHVLGMNQTSGAMFFGEQTPSGNIALWSFYPLADGRVLFIKQNNYAIDGTADAGLSVWNHAGYCQVTGGNGRALTE